MENVRFTEDVEELLHHFCCSGACNGVACLDENCNYCKRLFIKVSEATMSVPRTHRRRCYSDYIKQSFTVGMLSDVLVMFSSLLEQMEAILSKTIHLLDLDDLSS